MLTQGDTVQAVEEIEKAAEELKVQVEVYSKDFEEFQKTLDERNEKYVQLQKATENLFENLNNRAQEIGGMISRADEMLAGATNAGLATTFSKTLSELEGKLNGAQWGFYWAIGFLTVSALPLGAYLLLSSLDFSSPDSNGLLFSFTPGKLNPATTLALALLMVPIIWLTRFAAARHHQLFQLKKHYQYKYSLAMAVDGFKKQSPQYADEIAAINLHQLSFSPADKLAEKDDASDHPNPLITRIMDRSGMNEKGEN